jgi:hypothetical protein
LFGPFPPPVTDAYVAQFLPLLLLLGTWLFQIAMAWWLVFRQPQPRISSATWDRIAVIAVMVLALTMRAPLVEYGLPYNAMWDEVVTYSRSLHLMAPQDTPSVDTIPGYGTTGYGDILTTLSTAGSFVGLLDTLRAQHEESLTQYVSPPTGVQSIFQAVHTSGNPLRYPRLAFVLVNLLAPAAIYMTLRRHFRAMPIAALGGAAAYAFVSSDAVVLSSFILPDALATTLMLLSLLSALEGLSRGRRATPYWAIAGVFAGLGASTSLRSIVIPILPAIILLTHGDRRWLPKYVIAGVTGLAMGYLVGSPSLILDLPTFVSRAAGFTWLQDVSLHHRAESLVVYFQALFTWEGGLGPAILVASLVGLYMAFINAPHLALALCGFAAAHLYLVSPVVVRHPRHVLLLAPLACILAGNGLAGAAQWLRSKLSPAGTPLQRGVRQAVPALLLALLALGSLGQVRSTFRTVKRLTGFQPTQVQTAEFLDRILLPGDLVGIQQDLPFVERDLQDRGIPYRRVAAGESLADLRAQGIAYVVGSDRLSTQFGLPATGLWQGAFNEPAARLAEFGGDDLWVVAYPSANLYMFVARVPPP